MLISRSPLQVELVALVLHSPQDHPDGLLSLSLTGDLTLLKKTPLVIQEAAVYSLGIRFMANSLVSGLRYIQVVKRAGITVERRQEMLGSYAPRADGGLEPYEKVFEEEEAPSGMLARGTYTSRCRFVDDDDVVHAGQLELRHFARDEGFVRPGRTPI